MRLLNCVPCILKTCSRTSVCCMLTCSRANISCMLTCSHGNMSQVLTCLTCQHALRPYALTCQHALWAHVLTFQHALSPLSHMPCVTTWSTANTTCLACLEFLMPLFSVSLPLLLKLYTLLVRLDYSVNVFLQ